MARNLSQYQSYGGRSPYGNPDEETLLSLLDQGHPQMAPAPGQGAAGAQALMDINGGRPGNPADVQDPWSQPQVPDDSAQSTDPEPDPQDAAEPSETEAQASGPAVQQAVAPAPADSKYDALMAMLKQNQQPAAAAPEQDPAMAAKWKAAESSALDQANYDPGKYGVAEGLRDALPTVLASILDIGFNKGRGSQGIVTAGANEVAKGEAARLARAKAAGEFAVQARGHQKSALDAELERQRIAIAMAGLGLREKGLTDIQGRAEHNFQQAENPDSARNTTDVTVAGRKRTAQEQAALDTQAANVDRTTNVQSQIEAGKSGSAEGARIAVANQLQGVSAETAGTIEGAKETANVSSHRAAESANRPVPHGYALADQALFDNTNQDPGERAKMASDVTSARQLADASGKLAALRRKNGPQWLPNQQSGEYEALHTAVVGAANRTIADAGTLNAGEREMIERMVPGAKPNWKDFVGWLDGQNHNAQELEGFARGLQDVINSRVGTSYGLKYTGDQPTAQQQPATGAGRPSFNHDGNPVSGELGVTAGTPPKVRASARAAPAGGAKEYTVMVNGKPEKARLTPEQLQTLRSKGVQVQ